MEKLCSFVMLLSLIKIRLIHILLATITCVGTLSAQSLQELILTLPSELHMLGDDNQVKQLFSLSPGDSLPTGLWNESLLITTKSKDLLEISWNDHTKLSFVRLKSSKYGRILMLLRSTSSPFSISTVAFYDKSGEAIGSRFGLPPLSSELFFSEDTKEEERRILSILPVMLSYDGKKRKLSARLSTEGSLTVEDSDILDRIKVPSAVTFRWKRQGFTRE